MSVLVLLWVGTLGVIYASSYFEMTDQHERMLQTHADMYTLSPAFGEMTPPNKPRPDGNHGFNPDSPMFRLSTFYTVALSRDGDLLAVDNDPPTVYTDAELETLARHIVDGNRTNGTADNLAFLKADKDDYTLVVFMDNTVLNQSAVTLFRYTLIFGGAALVVFFFLSVFLARRIVAPLEDGYRKQKQFISDAGHELKTPVSVVSASAELLSREIGENQWLQNIQYENERMGLLVSQLLDLARTETVTPQAQRLNLSRLAAGEALPFESVAFEKGLVLNCTVAADIHVNGDGAQLKQLVSILLDNAIRHSGENGPVSLSLTADRGTATLAVVNRGDEIPAEQRGQIFERFYRLDTARNGEGNHYGLGLAIAKAIATAHKGHIEVFCYDGFVEFRVQLPTVS